MTRWWYFKGPMNRQKEEDRRRQQQEFLTLARMELNNPPRYESLTHTHHVNATGGIQINHTENGTQIITGSRPAYAESVPESSVTEDFEKNDEATEDFGSEAEDTDDSISHRKPSKQNLDKASEKFASRPSSDFPTRRSKASAGIQNNNTGNASQVHTYSHIGNIYNNSHNTGQISHMQFQNAVFYGDVDFRDWPISDSQEQKQHGKSRDGKGKKQDNDTNPEVSISSEDSGSASRPSNATGGIHVQDINTGSDIQITGDVIHVKEEDGSEVHMTGNGIHVKNGTGNKVHRSTPEVEIYGTASNYRGKGHNSSYSGQVIYGGIYNTGGGQQINGNIYGNLYL